MSHQYTSDGGLGGGAAQASEQPFGASSFLSGRIPIKGRHSQLGEIPEQLHEIIIAARLDSYRWQEGSIQGIDLKLCYHGTEIHTIAESQDSGSFHLLNSGQYYLDIIGPPSAEILMIDGSISILPPFRKLTSRMRNTEIGALERVIFQFGDKAPFLVIFADMGFLAYKKYKAISTIPPSLREHCKQLGVEQLFVGDQAAVRRAYWAIAKELHPDRKPNDPEAEERYKAAGFAYATIREAMGWSTKNELYK